MTDGLLSSGETRYIVLLFQTEPAGQPEKQQREGESRGEEHRDWRSLKNYLLWRGGRRVAGYFAAALLLCCYNYRRNNGGKWKPPVGESFVLTGARKPLNSHRLLVLTGTGRPPSPFSVLGLLRRAG